MFFISSRDQLENEDAVGAVDTYWSIQIENGRAIQRLAISLDALRDQLDGKNVLVLIHGYNNELEDILRAYEIVEEKMARHLPNAYDEVVGYTWPGGDSVTEWFPAKRRAGIVATRLAQNVQSLSQSVASIDLMSHSLGARVVLSALDRLPNDMVRANYLLASAVDNESVESGKKYYAATQRADRSVVFHSRHDGVLRYGYTAAEWDFALGLFGPEDSGSIARHSPNLTVANCKHVIDAHGAYKGTDEIYAFISRWLNNEIDQQFVTIEGNS